MSADSPPGLAKPLPSERFRLARLARDAALRVPGVTGTDPGRLGLFVTVGGSERLEGVVCAAAKQGGYDVFLRLVCELVPLQPLGEEVKAAVRRTANMAGIRLDSVDVLVAELATGEGH